MFDTFITVTSNLFLFFWATDLVVEGDSTPVEQHHVCSAHRFYSITDNSAAQNDSDYRLPEGVGFYSSPYT